MFRPCIRQELSIFEYDLLKCNFGEDSPMGSTFSLLFDGRTSHSICFTTTRQVNYVIWEMKFY